MDSRTRATCDYPLYNLSEVPSSIDISIGEPVVESGAYDLSVILPQELVPTEISLSINGSDPVTWALAHDSEHAALPENPNTIRIPIELEKQPFLLTYGFVRIEASLTTENQPQGEITLTTKDIPCFSSDGQQTAIIEGMLNDLLDSEEETVAGWMFTGKNGDPSSFSIIDAATRKNSPKSLSSLIQFFESCISEYENEYDYFRSHGFSKISQVSKRLPATKIRRTGSRELLWIAKNSHVLAETPYETSIDYLGKYYLPREIETSVRVKTYDSYENRIVLGFLDELIANARTICLSLRKQITPIIAIEDKLSLLKNEGYSLPALALIQQCAIRENRFIARLQKVIDNLQKLRRKYALALPGVDSQFTRNPRRTKIFQEVKSYSIIYKLVLEWLKYGDFTLARENLALHSLRLDKLYEYYTLFRLLCWLHSKGFTEDESEDAPIEQASYSLKSRYFRNEKRVATLYKLANNGVRIRLYYQPVIYGNQQEENGVTLHRLSCRKTNSKTKRDGYWTPDFMLMVKTENNGIEWHIFDSKFSKASTLWLDYPKSGRLTEVLSKYKMDIGGPSPSDKILSVWLFSGREQSAHVQFTEQSSWATRNYAQHHSGIGALTPAFSCLDEVLPPILRLDRENPDTDKATDSDLTEETISVRAATSVERDLPDRTQTKRSLQVPSNQCLPLVVELYNAIENKELLFKSRWSEVNLGLTHPLLRKTMPQGRERRYYTKEVVVDTPCYVYSSWLPNQKNKLLSYIEKTHRDE